MFNKKNDPLVHSVQKVMAENQLRRDVEAHLNEQLGIASKKALPFEHHAEYDALLEQRIAEAKAMEPTPERTSADDVASNEGPSQADKDALNAKIAGGPSQADKDALNAKIKDSLKEGSVPRTAKERKLAAMYGNKNEITKGDVLKARGVIDEGEEANRDDKPWAGQPKFKGRIQEDEFDGKKMPELMTKSMGPADERFSLSFEPKAGPSVGPDKFAPSDAPKAGPSVGPDKFAPSDAPKAGPSAYDRERAAKQGATPAVDTRLTTAIKEAFAKVRARRMNEGSDEDALAKVHAVAQSLKDMAQTPSPFAQMAAGQPSAPKLPNVNVASGPAAMFNQGSTFKLKEATEAQKSKVEKTMHEFSKGDLHSGSKKGPKVTSKKQAIAIALNQAGLSKKKVDESISVDSVLEEIRANLGEAQFTELMERMLPNGQQLTVSPEAQAEYAKRQANRPVAPRTQELGRKPTGDSANSDLAANDAGAAFNRSQTVNRPVPGKSSTGSQVPVGQASGRGSNEPNSGRTVGSMQVPRPPASASQTEFGVANAGANYQTSLARRVPTGTNIPPDQYNPVPNDASTSAMNAARNQASDQQGFNRPVPGKSSTGSQVPVGQASGRGTPETTGERSKFTPRTNISPDEYNPVPEARPTSQSSSSSTGPSTPTAPQKTFGALDALANSARERADRLKVTADAGSPNRPPANASSWEKTQWRAKEADFADSLKNGADAEKSAVAARKAADAAPDNPAIIRATTPQTVVAPQRPSFPNVSGANQGSPDAAAAANGINPSRPSPAAAVSSTAAAPTQQAAAAAPVAPARPAAAAAAPVAPARPTPPAPVAPQNDADAAMSAYGGTSSSTPDGSGRQAPITSTKPISNPNASAAPPVRPVARPAAPSTSDGGGSSVAPPPARPAAPAAPAPSSSGGPTISANEPDLAKKRELEQGSAKLDQPMEESVKLSLNDTIRKILNG